MHGNQAVEGQTSFLPPAGTPPLLNSTQLESLARDGYLNLDLPAHLTSQHEELFAASTAFFSGPLDHKRATFPSSPGNTEQGYTHIAGEKEFLTLRHVVHHVQPPEIERQIGQAWSDTATYLHRILNDVARYLSLAPEAWDLLLQHCLTLPQSRSETTPSLLRVFRYEPNSGIADPHRDLGLLTLCICGGRGLQVWRQSTTDAVTEGSEQDHDPPMNKPPAGEWIDAGRVTVLVGDTLRILSTARMASGLHRVIGNEDGRRSIVFALRPNVRHVIDLTMFGGEGTVAAAELWDAIRKSRINVNAQKEIREEQRLRNRKMDVC